MEQAHFCKSFGFHLLKITYNRHNDNSAGIPSHFIARMKSGKGLIRTLDGEELHLSAGDIFYLPMGLRYHSYWSVDERSGEVAWESYGFTVIPDRENRRFVMQRLFPSPESVLYLDRLAQDMNVSPSSVGLLYLFLGENLATMKETERNPKDELFRRASEYIRSHHDFRVYELARACNISESGLYAFFRDYAHTSPIQLKRRFAVDKGVELLICTDRTVEDIAAQLGFCSSAYFRKAVKAITGQTPSQIRKNARSM